MCLLLRAPWVVFIFSDPVTLAHYVLAGLIVTGVLGLNMASAH